MDPGDSRITFDPENLHGSRFTSRSPIPSKPQANKPLVGSGRSNSMEKKAGTSYEEWKPEQLSNGNYKRVSSLSLHPGPYLILDATTPARIEITAGISGILTSIIS